MSSVQLLLYCFDIKKSEIVLKIMNGHFVDRGLQFLVE